MTMRRADLYQAVWSDPVFHVAKRLNISDRGLTEVCKRLNVPTPPRGHWRKVQTGQQPSVSPLPDPEVNPVVVIEGHPVATGDEVPKVKTSQGKRSLDAVDTPKPKTIEPEIALAKEPVKSERGKAEELALALSKHRAVDHLLAELEMIRKFQPAGTAVVLGKWIEAVRSEQERSNPIAGLLVELGEVAKRVDLPNWWR